MRILSGRERGGKASLQGTVVKDVLVSQISKRHFCSGATQGLLPSWITCFDLPTAGAAPRTLVHSQNLLRGLRLPASLLERAF